MLRNFLDLIANLALLVALSNISGFLGQLHARARAGALMQGALFGLIAAFGMLRPLVLSPGIIFDGRSVVLSLCGLFFGPWAAAVACAMTVALRAYQGGAGALTGCLVIIASAVLGLLFRRLLRSSPADITSRSFLLLGIAAHVVMLLLMLTLPGGAGPSVVSQIGLPVLLIYPLVTVLIGKILAGYMASSRAMDTLRYSEERYRSILDASPDVITITDLKGRTLMVSPAAANMFGYACDKDMLGRSLGDFISSVDEERARDEWSKMLETSARFAGEYQAQRHDGSSFGIEVNGQFIRDAEGKPESVVLVVRDVTARQKADEARRRAEELMAQFVRHSPIYVYIKEVTATESRVLQASDNFVEMIGVPAAEMIGKTMSELFPAEFAAKITSDDWAVVSGAEILKIDEDLNGRHYTTIKFPIHLGEHSYLAGYTIDITDRRRMEDERLQLEAKLAQIQKMEGIGNLAGGVAHDMNNVLGAIMGLASATMDTVATDSSAHAAFATILKASERGGKMVRGLLSFARQSLAEERVLDLNEILRDEVSLLERTTLSRISIKLELANDLHPMLGDPSALSHLFMNLCVNALDAMNDNGVITLRTRNVDDAWIEALVEDDGHGMSKEILAKAMDPFFTTKAQGMGTGLGLALAYSVVKAHRGQIELRSEERRGTQVLVRFPASASAVPHVSSPAEARPVSSASPLRVLVVDDDELVQASLRTILKRLGHRATGASSGEQALQVFAEGACFDVVILDLNMPGLGGAGTLPKIRALEPQLPILLATGRADQTAISLVEEYSHVVLLSKPFGIAELRAKLAAVAQPRASLGPEPAVVSDSPAP